MTMVDPILDTDFDAYADGQLSPQRRIEVEAHLARHPEAAARVMADLSLRGQLRLSLRTMAEPAGTRETREAARRLERRLRFSQIGQTLQRAAAIGLFVAAGWAASTTFGPLRVTDVVASEPPPAHVEEAVRAHRTTALRETMTSQPEIPTYDPEDIRAATAIVLPNLPQDWTVVDVQVFPSRFGPSVELAITAPDEGRLSLFAVRPGVFAVRPVQTYAIEDARAAGWQIGEVAYALVSSTDTTKLPETAERLSKTLY